MKSLPQFSDFLLVVIFFFGELSAHSSRFLLYSALNSISNTNNLILLSFFEFLAPIFPLIDFTMEIFLFHRPIFPLHMAIIQLHLHGFIFGFEIKAFFFLSIEITENGGILSVE